MGTVGIDPAFVQDIEHRPKPTRFEAEGIPLIDLSVLNSPNHATEADLESLVSEIGDASRKWGFFQVINHGVPQECRDRIELASRKFLGLPKEEKLKVKRDGVNFLGYYDAENTKNIRDWKEMFDFILREPTIYSASPEPDDERLQELTCRWPQNPPELREVCLEYAHLVEKLGFKLMELIALSLGLPKNRFNGYFKAQTSFCRLNYYPPCPSPDLALGVGRHKDPGALSILAQDEVGGLEVKRKSDGEWILVKPTPNAFIINVGDILQVWSNDIYESVEDRVRLNSEKGRFPTAFFINPAHYVWVEPLEELNNEQNPLKYKAYNWGKYTASRKQTNFKKHDVENVQISCFKIV